MHPQSEAALQFNAQLGAAAYKGGYHYNGNVGYALNPIAGALQLTRHALFWILGDPKQKMARVTPIVQEMDICDVQKHGILDLMTSFMSTIEGWQHDVPCLSH